MMNLNQVENNNEISELIKSGNPLSIIRLRSETDVLLHMNNNNDITSHYKYGNNGGLYPQTIEIFNEYAKHIHEGLLTCDALIYWQHLNPQYLAYSNIKDYHYMHNRAVEPFYFKEPWSQQLKGKKVLVIHPFEQTIKQQYNKRGLIFNNGNILPDFDLITYKSIQTSGNGSKDYETWTEALEYMLSDISNINFDIALIGCGCYDIPISTFIKKMGKQSIIIGGGLQILFGIKGKRWDNHEVISKLYNEYWVRPSVDEKPNNYNGVEGGCYW